VAHIIKQALTLGPNQEGLLLNALLECYQDAGILEDRPETWSNPSPTFADLERKLVEWAQKADSPYRKEAEKLLLKMARTFAYGIFTQPQPALDRPLIRIALEKLPPEIQTVAAESIARQILAQHRLEGETKNRVPRTFLVIDEARNMTKGKNSVINTVLCDGRKYGLGLILASQSDEHFTSDVLLNTSTKIVLPVDQTQVTRVATKFRFNPERLATLMPLTALVRLGNQALETAITPYYRRTDAEALT
jgi:hypothetical protein